jgi:hypothetical protein
MQLPVVVANIRRHLAIRDRDIWVPVAVQISNCRIPCRPFPIAVASAHLEVADAVVSATVEVPTTSAPFNFDK